MTRKSIDVVAVVKGDVPPEGMAGGSPIALSLDPGGRLLGAIGSRVVPVTVVVDGGGAVASMIFLYRESYRRDLWRQLRELESPDGIAAAGQAAAAGAARREAVRGIRDLVRAGQPDEAHDAITWVRRQHGDRFTVRMELGKALLALARSGEAVADFQAARKAAPASLRAKLWLGIALARSDDDQRAEGLLRGVAEFMPDAWRAYGELGLIESRRGNAKEATLLLRRSVVGEAGRIWATGGAWVGAAAPMLEVVDIEGRPAPAATPLSAGRGGRATVVLFWRTGDEASLSCLRQLHACLAGLSGEKPAVAAINVDRRRPTDTDRARVGEAAREAGVSFPVWLDAELESFARYDVQSIPTMVVIDARGVVAARIVGGDLSALGASLSGAPRAGADRRAGGPDRYLAMSRHLARQDRVESAIESVRRCLRESPARPDAVALLARLLAASGRSDAAAELLAEATKDGDRPLPAGLSTVYGDVLRQRGLHAEAKVWYDRALEICPGYGLAHVGLGRVFAAGNDVTEALREARLAAESNPHGEHIWVFLAEALASAGRPEEAFKAYEAAYERRRNRSGVFARNR